MVRSRFEHVLLKARHFAEYSASFRQSTCLISGTYDWTAACIFSNCDSNSIQKEWETKMSEEINNNRRHFLGTAAMTIAAAQVGVFGSADASVTGLVPAKARAAAEDKSIHPFHINVPEADLVDVRRRLAATRWPDQETVSDRSQGVQLATMKELVRYWQTDYDWRKVESRLNALKGVRCEAKFMGRVGAELDVEAGRQEAPLFAKSIERHPLRDK